MTAESKSIPTETLLRQLHWRYATKKFDPTKKIPDAEWDALEQALVLTPTSYGLQPFRILVITDLAIREQLVPVSWNQRQPLDCSHFVLFARKTTMSTEDVDRYLARIAEVRGTPLEALNGYRGMMISDVVEGARSEILHEWTAHQAYIALGNFMSCAALLGVDTCPMEGFVPAKYDEILGLKEKGLAACVACAAGYRSPDCVGAKQPKVRLPMDEMIIHV